MARKPKDQEATADFFGESDLDWLDEAEEEGGDGAHRPSGANAPTLILSTLPTMPPQTSPVEAALARARTPTGEHPRIVVPQPPPGAPPVVASEPPPPPPEPTPEPEPAVRAPAAVSVPGQPTPGPTVDRHRLPARAQTPLARRPAAPLPPFVHRDGIDGWREVVEILTAEAAARSGADRAGLLGAAARVALTHVGDLEIAQEHMSAALGANATRADDHRLYARIVRSLDWPEEETLALRAAAATDPDDYTSRARLLDLVPADSAAERSRIAGELAALADGGIAADLHVLRGDLEAAEGRSDAARAAYEAALAEEPEHSGAFVGMESLLATDPAALASLYEREAARLAAAGRTDRECAWWHIEAARAWRSASRTDRAAVALHAAHRSGAPEAAAALEALHLASGDVGERDALLASEMASSSPGRAFAGFRLGWLREQEDDADGALEAYRSALAADPAAAPALDVALRLLRERPAERRALLEAQPGSADPASRPWHVLALAELCEVDGDETRARDHYVSVLDAGSCGTASAIAWGGLDRTLRLGAPEPNERWGALARRFSTEVEDADAVGLRAAALYRTARTLFDRLGRSEEARLCAVAAMRADPACENARWLVQQIAGDPPASDAAADFRDRAALASDPVVRGWYRFAAGVAADGADGRDDFEVVLGELPGHAGAARALEVALAAGDDRAELADLYVERADAGAAWDACTAAALLASTGRANEAIAELERVPELTKDADDAPARVAARLARRLGAREQAAEILSGSDDDHDQAERAWLLAALGRPRDALPIVLAITAEPVDGDEDPDPIATAARGGEIALGAGDIATAARLFERVAQHSTAPAVRAFYAARVAAVTGGEPPADPSAEPAGGLADLVIAARLHELADDWSRAYTDLSTWRELARDPAVIAGADARRRWLLGDKLAGSDDAWELYRGLHEDAPDDRGVTERLAGIAAARGEGPLAVRYMEELASSTPDPADAARLRVRIARIHEESGHASSARQAYLDALDHTPDSRDAVDGLRRVAVRERDWPALIAVLDREAGSAPRDRAIELRAEIARVTEDRIQDAPVAMDRWRAVLELDPEHDEALSRLLALSERLGEWGVFVDAGEVYARRLPPPERAVLLRRIGVACQDQLGRDDAVRFFEEAVAFTPPDLEAARRLEGHARAHGEWPQVVRALELQAEAEPEPDGKRAALFRAARIQVESLQDHDAAAATYRRILQLHPDDEQALRFVGQHLFEQGAFEEALEICERLDPVAERGQDLEDFDTRIELSGFYFMFAELLAQRGEIDAALARYERALALNPTHLQSLEAVAPLYTDRRQWAKAERVYRQLLQLTGGQGDKLRVAATYTALGLIERELGATEKAYKRFGKALELHPHDVGALKGMALVLEDKADWSNLLNVYNNIIYHATLPTDVIDAYMTKGRILDDHMQRQDKAAQHYQRSLDFDPNQPEAWLRLAELAARRGAWAEAGDLADKGLDLAEHLVDPFRARLLLVRAAAWQGTGHTARAEDFLGRAIARDPAVVQELGETPLGNLDQIRARLRELTGK